MLRCNLAILMAEQNLRITKISSDTGISRTTLTSLANNHSSGIQFDTLNTLCMYLKVSPEALISFTPIDVKICEVNCFDENSIDIESCVTINGVEIDFSLVGLITSKKISDYVDTSMTIFIQLPELISDVSKAEIALVTKAFRQLPRSFLTDIESLIEDKIPLMGEILDSDCLPEVEYRFTWSRDLRDS